MSVDLHFHYQATIRLAGQHFNRRIDMELGILIMLAIFVMELMFGSTGELLAAVLIAVACAYVMKLAVGEVLEGTHRKLKQDLERAP